MIYLAQICVILITHPIQIIIGSTSLAISPSTHTLVICDRITQDGSPQPKIAGAITPIHHLSYS
ncbi:hypothetical protein [Microcoleus sp. FACHB-SPT15]|uniref:hypothetical protein n=1 Tax=Microcoleus sp. FACHB-SPT15 TaxID=2692830 RepID=UPI00177A9E56|nr:hypothetical protein [Microcoleus sp. FACHB-SPT15]